MFNSTCSIAIRGSISASLLLLAAVRCGEPKADSGNPEPDATSLGGTSGPSSAPGSDQPEATSTAGDTTRSAQPRSDSASAGEPDPSGGDSSERSGPSQSQGSSGHESLTEALTNLTSTSGPSTSNASTSDSSRASTTGPASSDESSGASSAPEALNPTATVGAMDGLLYRGECASSEAADECHPAGCVDDVFEQVTKVMLEGDDTKTYVLQIHIYGVVELRKGYMGGVRRQGATGNNQSMKDFWYEGGSFEPGNYNVYALRVTPAVPGVPNPVDNTNHYFLNARDTSNEGHEVWELDYTAEIQAQGGSEIAFQAYDQNCTQIQNVGSAARPARGTGPDGALVVMGLESAEPPPPVDFQQPLVSNDLSGQWVYVDVVSVTEVTDN